MMQLFSPLIFVFNLFLVLPYLLIIPLQIISFIIGGILQAISLLPGVTWIIEELDNISLFFAEKMMKDKRDVPFIQIMLLVSPLVISSFFWQLISPEFNWVLAIVHYVVLFGPNKFDFYFRVFVCKHIEAHRFQGLYKKPYSFLNRYFEWFLGIYYGNIPEMDRCAHVGIHHVENNNYDDNQSPIMYDRSNLIHFFRYVLNNAYWHNSGVGSLVYFYKNRRWKLFRKMSFGVAFFYSLMGILLWVNWLFAVIYFVIPYLLNNAVNAVVGWTWHGFSDPEDPNNYYTGTITIINDADDFMNEDYHLSHHINPVRHWTDSQRHFLENKELYRDKKATVFHTLSLLDIFLLMTVLKKFDLLAKYYVDLTCDLSQKEIIQLLKERTHPVS